MIRHVLRGLFPPIPTPFLRGEVSLERLADNLALWNKLPLDGYVLLGSNGEAPLLDDHERAAVIRAAREATPADRAIIVGSGRESTRATIRSVNEAFELGADAALVGVPGYYRPVMTDDVLADHYQRVADASHGPVLLYSVPFFTGIPIQAPLFRRLIRHDRVAGIKDSSGDPASIEALVGAAREAGREVSVLVGSQRALAEGLKRGASGAVLAVGNVAARACARIAQCVQQGDHDEAARLNQALLPLTEAVTARHGIGGLKAALDMLGFFGGEPRPPLPSATAEARAEIAALLKTL
ncbi:MAG: dihydrodipicolinate synthase family protein [Candidatus Polarisedimenticolia bacterium]